MQSFEHYLNYLANLAVAYAPKVLLAIITLIAGLWVIKIITNKIDKGLEKRDMEVSLRNFLKDFTSILLKILLILSVISVVGIETTSFVAILAAAGFAVGMALQGSLGNFAGGVLILILKPYRVGDYIEGAGYAGSVNSIQVFFTVLKTPDNVTVVIPNGQLSNSPIKNYTTEAQRRVDFVFGIGYNDDINKARDVIKSIIDGDQRILKEPEPQIVISELGDSSVNFAVRVWCAKEDYWSIYFDMHEQVKKDFDKNGISIPFPQTDVHLFKENS